MTMKIEIENANEEWTAKEILNLVDWLREQEFNNDKIVECLETVAGRKDR